MTGGQVQADEVTLSSAARALPEALKPDDGADDSITLTEGHHVG
jgi:hypothetical protein